MGRETQKSLRMLLTHLKKKLKIFMKVVSIHKPQSLTFYVPLAAYLRTWRKLRWGGGGAFLAGTPESFCSACLLESLRKWYNLHVWKHDRHKRNKIISSHCLVTKSCLALLQAHGLYPTRFLCPWNFPGKNTGVGCHFLFQGIFRPRHWATDKYI